MSADRASYGDRQAALLDALVGAGPVPDGFIAQDVRAGGDSLARKRARAAADAWPALAHQSRFAETFGAFARRHPPPAPNGGLADGFAFAASLGAEELGEDARVELWLARALLVRRGSVVAIRRGPYVAAPGLRDPPRLLIVLRLPWLGRRVLCLPSAKGG